MRTGSVSCNTVVLMSDLGNRIRAKIDAGALPAEPPKKLIAGHGENAACSACDLPIVPSQVEWSIGDTDHLTHRFHIGCHAVWRSELRKGRALRPQLSPFERVTMQLATHERGLCLPCLEAEAGLAPDTIEVLIADLESVVRTTRVEATCPLCGEERRLLRL